MPRIRTSFGTRACSFSAPLSPSTFVVGFAVASDFPRGSLGENETIWHAMGLRKGPPRSLPTRRTRDHFVEPERVLKNGEGAGASTLQTRFCSEKKYTAQSLAKTLPICGLVGFRGKGGRTHLLMAAGDRR